MKKIYLILALFAGLASCEKKGVYKAPDVENLMVTTLKHVEVPEGKVAIVRFYEDTLAIVTQTSDIVVPKEAMKTRAFDNAISIEYLDNNNNWGNKYQIWQVLAFEDSESGDYDYNDLIVHVRILQHANNTQFAVHPIALGSEKPIRFGVRVGDQDMILAESCRDDLFEGLEGFINTEVDGLRHKYEDVKRFSLNTTCTFGKDINWFIEVDGGKRLYAVSKNYPSLNARKMAYGLIIMNINDYYTFGNEKTCGGDWFAYPQEKVRITEVYPDFDLLLNSESSFRKIFSNQQEGYYPAINADENRVVTAEGCLYAITIK